MSEKNPRPQALRELAQAVVGILIEEGCLLPSERADYNTSLVRQWLTYDGNATFFLGEEQGHFRVEYSSQGQLRSATQRSRNDWGRILMEDWKLTPEQLPDLLAQFNLGQSAETINSDGLPLRFWANPQERTQGIERLAEEERRPKPSDYRTIIAASRLKSYFGPYVDGEKLDALAVSLAGQWQKYGVGCLFHNGNRILFKILENADGCNVDSSEKGVEIEVLLHRLGIAPEDVPDVLDRFNLDREVSFLNREGVPSIMWHDPRDCQVRVRPHRSGAGEVAKPSPSPSGKGMPQSDVRADGRQVSKPSPSPFCPQCSAVLKPWKAGDRPRTCPQCGCSAND